MSIQNVRFNNSVQVINMGGPWVGDLYYGERLISKDAIVDNVIFDHDKQWLLFVKYYCPSYWASGIYFTINYFDFNNESIFESDKKFNILFIKQVEEGKLEIYRAFHDSLIGTKDSFNLYDETYHLLGKIG